MTREEAIERFENVKANALVQKASGVSEYWQNEIDGTIEAIDMAIEALQADAVSRKDTVTLNSPISIQAEMVAVVRCKECKHFTHYGDGCGVCTERDNILTYQNQNDYCSYGERKGGDDE